MKKIVFLVSGSGGSLRFLYHSIKQLDLDIEINGVLGDRDCPALDFANRKEIYAKNISYNRNLTSELQAELELLKPDLIITNIHKIIDSGTLGRFPGSFINLHYSLLPGFGGIIGMETVTKAKEKNTGFIGGTCHLVNEDVDAGMIIQQGCFPVDWSDDKDVVDTLFKTSSICLLGGVITKLRINRGRSDKLLINNRTVYFSPALRFDNFFDDKFWDLIKESN